MFNGIIETLGEVCAIIDDRACVHLTIKPKQALTDIQIGESVAVNGVCLTVTQVSTHTFTVTVVPETLRLTNLKRLMQGAYVNLERALRANARISGHYVQGHVDGLGEIISLKQDNSDALLVTIQFPPHLAQYIVNKGFITLDGMSITVIDVKTDELTVTFIPHTQAVTIIKHYYPGYAINIEVDMMGKYIEKLVGVYAHALPSKTC